MFHWGGGGNGTACFASPHTFLNLPTCVISSPLTEQNLHKQGRVIAMRPLNPNRLVRAQIVFGQIWQINCGKGTKTQQTGGQIYDPESVKRMTARYNVELGSCCLMVSLNNVCRPSVHGSPPPSFQHDFWAALAIWATFFLLFVPTQLFFFWTYQFFFYVCVHFWKFHAIVTTFWCWSSPPQMLPSTSVWAGRAFDLSLIDKWVVLLGGGGEGVSCPRWLQQWRECDSQALRCKSNAA